MLVVTRRLITHLSLPLFTLPRLFENIRTRLHRLFRRRQASITPPQTQASASASLHIHQDSQSGQDRIPSPIFTSRSRTVSAKSFHSAHSSSNETLAQSGESFVDEDGVNIRVQTFQLELPPRNLAEQYVQAIYHEPGFVNGLLELYGFQYQVDGTDFTVPELVAAAANLIPHLSPPPSERGSSLEREADSSSSSSSVSTRSSLEIPPPAAH